MTHSQRQIWVRLIFHGLLAVFIANAANKFFTADLDYEISNGFYERIYEGEGDAPDQYRILPLLPLKYLTKALPFNHAVLVYNAALGLLVLELFWWIMGGIEPKKKYTFQVLFGLCYIYAQFSGWRPDTLGLLLLASLLVLPSLWPSSNDSFGKNLLTTFLLIALSFARSDIALVYAVFLSLYGSSNWLWRVPWLTIPIGVQAMLQLVIFPEATYYSKKIMLLDNLSGFYLLRHPATYLIAATLLVFWQPLRAFVRKSWRFRWLYLTLLAYLGLVLVIGRINEWRLYLPFVPILLAIWRETQSLEHGEDSGTV